jgi:hypothetical protein
MLRNTARIAGGQGPALAVVAAMFALVVLEWTAPRGEAAGRNDPVTERLVRLF